MPILDFDEEREKLSRRAMEMYAKANIEIAFCGISKETYTERVERVKEWHRRHLQSIDEMERSLTFQHDGEYVPQRFDSCTCPKYRLGVCYGCKQREFRKDREDAELRGDS